MVYSFTKGRFVSLVIGCMLLGFGSPVSATLIGDTVSCALSGTSQVCSAPSAVVIDPGVEFTFAQPGQQVYAQIDIDDSTITITALIPLFLGDSAVILSDLDWIGQAGIIQNATLQNFGVDPFSGVGPSISIFDDHSVTISIRGLWDPGDSVLVSLTASHGVVAEPPALVLFGLGLVGLGLARRRKMLKAIK